MEYSTLTGSDIETAAYWLRQGACVAVPTETVYGLAANALDPAAVARIFTIKNRPAFDPLIVHVPDADAAANYVQEMPDLARILMEHFWPGPLTVLLPRNERIPDLVTSGLPRVALRAPDHPLALALLRALPFPLAAPSANPFGYVSPTTARHVFDQLQSSIPYILDGGPCRIGVESTIVGFEEGETVVYRLGGLPVEALEAVAGPVTLRLNQSSNPAAPGMLSAHYAPRKPLLLDSQPPVGSAGRLGLLTFGPPTSGERPDVVLQINLSETGDLEEAAQNLFAALRTLDQADLDLILARSCPEEGLGRAINDRLRRASRL